LLLTAIADRVARDTHAGRESETIRQSQIAELTATLSDNSSVMLVGKYSNGPVKLFAGYDR
jgi:hypothetical protein